jgi:hypothetical protein
VGASVVKQRERGLKAHQELNSQWVREHILDDVGHTRGMQISEVNSFMKESCLCWQGDHGGKACDKKTEANNLRSERTSEPTASWVALQRVSEQLENAYRQNTPVKIYQPHESLKLLRLCGKR